MTRRAGTNSSRKTNHQRRKIQQGKKNRTAPPKSKSQVKPISHGNQPLTARDSKRAAHGQNSSADQESSRVGNSDHVHEISETRTEQRDKLSRVDEILERAQYPGRILTIILVQVSILGSLFWPKYVINPTQVTGPLHRIIILVIAAILFLSFTTLTTIAYCLLGSGNTETNKKFLSVVMNRAGIGATIGTLLGVRLAPEALGPGGSAAFTNYLGDLGNAITLMTLVTTATAWPYTLGPLKKVFSDSHRIDWVPQRIKDATVYFLVLGTNGVGAILASIVYLELIRN